MGTKYTEPDRVISFSHRPDDEDAIKNVAKLKAYGRKRGISFSFLTLKAIKNLLEELNDESREN